MRGGGMSRGMRGGGMSRGMRGGTGRGGRRPTAAASSGLGKLFGALRGRR
jgi:hypothetical protein